MRVRLSLLLLIVAALAIPFLITRAQTDTANQQSEEQTENLEIYIVQAGTVRDFVEVSGSLDANATAWVKEVLAR